MTGLHLALAAAVLAGDPATVARRVVYHEADILPIYTQVGFITAVHLPTNEKVVDEHVANDEFFKVSHAANVLYIKPGDFPGYGGLKTNIEAVLASGNTISLMAYEVSKTSGAHADLKVFVTEGDKDAVDAANAAPKYVDAAELERLKVQQKEREFDLQKQIDEAHRQAALAATKEAVSIRHDYELVDRKGKDFHATVYTDGKFTYVEVDAQELPSVWEERDGKLNKIDAVYRDGRYTIEHVVDTCELRVGKSEAKYRRKNA